MSTNLKMQHTGLVECYEIEQLKPCMFFGEGLCPSCYAEPLLKLRVQNSRHVHKSTSQHGLIRLGTYKEVTPEDWECFKKGEGTWSCCGAPWHRPDFPTRPYYYITRGLSPQPFYEKVLADAYLANLQVSTDILAQQIFTNLNTDELVIPDRKRLAFFNQYPKVMFRFKTTPGTVGEFIKLAGELGIDPTKVDGPIRIMETPLRTPDVAHAYGTYTPLQLAGWPTQKFGRCNTTCDRCRGENGMLLCGANANMLERLPSIERPPPFRLEYPQMRSIADINWTTEAVLFLNAMGGKGTVARAYAWLDKKYPVLALGKPSYKFKFRVGIQRVADKFCPKCGTVFPRKSKINTSIASRVCAKCGTPAPKEWTLRPKHVKQRPAIVLASK